MKKYETQSTVQNEGLLNEARWLVARETPSLKARLQISYELATLTPPT